jgi:hypothetical protein
LDQPVSRQLGQKVGECLLWDGSLVPRIDMSGQIFSP